jgi:hypothetical protein
MHTLDDYRRFKAAVLANLTEFGTTPFFTTTEQFDIRLIDTPGLSGAACQSGSSV